MNLKNLVLTAALGGSLASSALAADVYLYITGAPAFRANTNDSIHNRVVALGGSLIASSNADATIANIRSARANKWRIPNYPVPGDNLIVNVAHQGAAAAIQSVASNGTKTQLYIPDSVGLVTPAFSQAQTEPHAGDIAFANIFQVSTGFIGTKTFRTGPDTTNTDTYAALYRSQPLAISPYRFVASKGFPKISEEQPWNNVTSQQLEALFKYGPQPLAFFTGKAEDQGTYVYATGRDNGSGLRIATQAETGVGLSTPVYHYKPTVTNSEPSGSNLVNGRLQNDAPDIWPAGVVPSTGFYYDEGDTGYVEFGGNNQNTAQLSALTAQTKDDEGNPTGQYYLIASLEATDAATAIAAGATDLTYNGVAYTPQNLQEGRYPFWAYQFLYRKTTLSGVKRTFSDLLEANWSLLSSVSASSLNVQRISDGGTLTPLY